MTEDADDLKKANHSTKITINAKSLFEKTK